MRSKNQWGKLFLSSVKLILSVSMSYTPSFTCMELKLEKIYMVKRDYTYIGHVLPLIKQVSAKSSGIKIIWLLYLTWLCNKSICLYKINLKFFWKAEKNSFFRYPPTSVNSVPIGNQLVYFITHCNTSFNNSNNFVWLCSAAKYIKGEY